ncbi:sugar/nucleoside kinase (ribokinase family) [Krasilnikovia cinnamomea]|uniref:Sugar/nucleoside kinase (Ribokinase family) n=1 Tax=Krasilnikovia cinnamomea TaxID=349313 RepID=A0A4Q7ZCD2_9ACTN|nr:PfkB family carbohydrate kinase [Krasilnikovia cinnamomea]RZU48300.1 sugar/nucleoside kinase (ribokinase family) [Krasilnikovia cinnamomea]
MTVRVVCVGLATVDLIQRVDRIPGADEKVEAGSAELAAGGPATNAAVAAAALGAEVTLVTAVGTHPLAAVIRADLSTYGVSVLDATPTASTPPPVSAVTVLAATGQRSIVSRNAGGLSAPAPAALTGVLSRADAVLVDGHHPALATAAARAGRPLIVDAGSWRPVFADVLPHAEVVACSATFRHPELPDPAAILDLGARHVAVTAGPEPVRWFAPGAAGEVPVPPVAAVDTAGAGDVFHGALAVAVARDGALSDLPGSLGYAVAVAGIRVGHAGPRAWLADPRLATLSLTASPR